MPKLKLVHNVGEFGIFKSVARSRGTLAIAALLGVAACAAFGWWTNGYVFERSASVGLNMLVITANMITIMVAAYLLALLAGDVFFPGPWREQVILGDRNFRGDEDVPVVVADHSAEFLILCFVFFCVGAVGLNMGAGGFLSRYHDEGYFQVRLRSEEAPERLDSLVEMADPMQRSLWENGSLQDAVVESLSDPDPSVRAQAAWNAGKMEVRRAERRLREIVVDEEETPEVRGEAGVALAKLNPEDLERAALVEMLAKAEGKEMQMWALRAIALGEVVEAQSVLEGMASTEDEELLGYVFWAMRKAESPQAREYLRAQLEGEGEGLRRCVLLDTLKMVATAEDVTWARREFMRAPRETRCARVFWQERDEAVHNVVFDDPMRVKYMKIVANSGQGAEQKVWYQRLANDQTEVERVRVVASEILAMLAGER